MKKIFKNPIFTFALGALVFGGIAGVSAYNIFANDIGYAPQDSTWNVNNVKGAIDDLYAKVKPDYNGLTTFTPTTSIQTIPTNNKILRSNIIINAIPSTYKNLTITTDVSSSNLLNGVKAYTSDGELVTGNISTNCISGSYIKPANSQININLGFTPTKAQIYFVDGGGKKLVNYSSNIDNDFHTTNFTTNSITTTTASYGFESNKFVSYFNTAGTAYQNSITIYFMACK